MWKTLRHPNVLSLIGVTMTETQFAMISEWMANGNINDFVRVHPDVDRFGLLRGVPGGLIYIHNQGMVHGDLKGANILIDGTGNAHLADFGLLTILSDPTNPLSSGSFTQGGTARWMGPELIDPQRFGADSSRPTKYSDCYALGMVVYETISGHLPFHQCADLTVFVKVIAGECPTRGAGFAESLWKMLTLCWAPRPSDRPGIQNVLQCLDEVLNSLESPPFGLDEEMEGDRDEWYSTDDSFDEPMHIDTPKRPGVADNKNVISRDGNAEICRICGELVKYYSVSECNHRTCHICALRFRVLEKRRECLFCKEPQSSLIFTTSPVKPFTSFRPIDVPFKNVKLSISFETKSMMEMSLRLLQFHCPHANCDHTASGWINLRLHVEGVHGNLMCGFCIQIKRIFVHEYKTYPPNLLPSHVWEKHQECSICHCDLNGTLRPHFKNYDALEIHFATEHYLCRQRTCLDQRFVVFDTKMGLKGHMIEEHGTKMSLRDGRHRRPETSSECEVHGQYRRRGAGGNHERDRVPLSQRQLPNARQRESGSGFAANTPGPSRLQRKSWADSELDSDSGFRPQVQRPGSTSKPQPKRTAVSPPPPSSALLTLPVVASKELPKKSVP